MHAAGTSFYFTRALQARYAIGNPVQPYNRGEFWIKSVWLTARVLKKLIRDIYVGSKEICLNFNLSLPRNSLSKLCQVLHLQVKGQVLNVVRCSCSCSCSSDLYFRHYQTISDQINRENKIPGVFFPEGVDSGLKLLITGAGRATCLQYLHEVSNCLWIALTSLFRIGQGFECCHFSFMTSKGPVVKIGKEHSQRNVGNQRCFLSNSHSDLGTTTPAAHGKVSS